MVRAGAKLVPLANVPFASRDEWHTADMCVKGWLQRKSRWEQTELADAANALPEWTLDGTRLGGKDIKKQRNGDEERACAWLVGLGVSQAAAARIYRGCNPEARGPVTSAATQEVAARGSISQNKTRCTCGHARKPGAVRAPSASSQP
jgi:hypothetical protein